MHDIDRTLTELDPEMEEYYETDQSEFDEYEYGDSEGVFDEATEMQMASELLAVSDEAELEQFLGGLIKKAGRAIGKFVKTPTGQALTGMLKGAAKKYLPTVAGAVGTAFGGPVGAALSSQLTSQANWIFGLELEGLSPEDQEFETAKHYVRWAGEAAKNAALAPPTADPVTAAKSAAVTAAQQHAPGLLRSAPRPPAMGMGGRVRRGRSGRWFRLKGDVIVLRGV